MHLVWEKQVLIIQLQNYEETERKVFSLERKSKKAKSSGSFPKKAARAEIVEVISPR